MSKIFKISGNFMQDGEWSKPDPAFIGKIAVNEDGKFCGYCKQLCIEGVSDKNNNEVRNVDKYRALVGAMAEEGDGYSLLFFKLSNEPWQAPLAYEVHDSSLADSVWSAKDPSGGFVAQGNARAWLEELSYTEESETRIKEQFCEVDISIGANNELINELGKWQKKTLVLWA